MPVPSSLSDLSTNASSNSPQGTESAKGTIDDYLRSHAAFIAQVYAIVAGATVTIASSSTVAIGAAQSSNIAITGTSTISAFDTVAEGVTRLVAFSGALTLTHNAATLILPGAANITTAAGDVASFKSLGGGAWKCMSYQPVAGYLAAATAAQAFLAKAGGAMTGPLILAEGSVGAPGLTFASDSGNNTGLCHLGDDVIGIVCGGALVGRFTTTGFEAIKVTQKALP